MKRTREEETQPPARKSRRLLHVAEGRAGISHFTILPELITEIGKQLLNPAGIKNLYRATLVCRRFRDAMQPLLALPDWLCRVRDQEKYPDREHYHHYRFIRKTWRALFICEELRLLMKWQEGRPLRSSLWSKFNIEYGGAGIAIGLYYWVDESKNEAIEIYLHMRKNKAIVDIRPSHIGCDRVMYPFQYPWEYRFGISSRHTFNGYEHVHSPYRRTPEDLEQFWTSLKDNPQRKDCPHCAAGICSLQAH